MRDTKVEDVMKPSAEDDKADPIAKKAKEPGDESRHPREPELPLLCIPNIAKGSTLP